MPDKTDKRPTTRTLTKEALYALRGKTVTIVDFPPDFGYEPRGVWVEVDGKKYLLEADTVSYDQYSQSPCLAIKEIIGG